MPTPALIDILRSRSCSTSAHQARVATERHEREVVPVEMVAEVEVARESRAREEPLLPRPVRTLAADEPGNTALHRLAPRAVGRQQPEQCPGSLRRRALALP